MAATTKQELERLKLQVEIRKLEAEARTAELTLADDERLERNQAAKPDNCRLYTFIGAVTRDSAKDCMDRLGYWARREPGSDLTVIFNSPGGSVIDGLALFDSLDELKRNGHRVTTVARGMAASMGGVLLQAGHDRVIGPNAHLLIHEVSSLGAGKLSEMEDEVAFCRRLQSRLLDILAERSTLSKQQIARRWRKTDWWLDAREAVEFGFADRIG